MPGVEIIKALPFLDSNQKKILARIGELAEKERTIDERVNEQLRSGVWSSDGVGIISVESMEELVITGHPLAKDLSTVRSEIKAQAQLAVDSGLGYLGIIQRQEPGYGVKLTEAQKRVPPEVQKALYNSR